MISKRSMTSAAAAGLLAITSVAGSALGASHREAPLIAFDPSADITDLYAFVSPDREGTVTLIANYHPFQEPGAGPNYYPFNPEVTYWIKVDNTGDGVADRTYTFNFTTNVANPDSFLYSGYGPIGAVDSNVTQTFSLARNGETIADGLDVPPPNIGPRTTPDYGASDYVAGGIHNLGEGDGQVFAGQVDDPFFGDIGAIFDLGGLRPFNEAHLIPLENRKGEDTFAAFNVNAIAIQVPHTDLTNDGQEVSAPDAANAVIGVWAGASRMALSVDGGVGELVQVSRLGNPLINEVIIPIGQKDEWNAGEPADDAQYMDRYLNPELAAIVNTVYPSLPDARTSEREDLVLILGRGVPGLNQTNTDGLYDMLRLNMGVPPAEDPDRMGAVAGDVAGFPNGRRLIDDVIDIEIRAIIDGYGEFLAENFGLPNLEPNNAVGDGCDSNDVSFRDGGSFPYLGDAHQGYSGGEYRKRCGS
ncbi:DUF4331 domain-containing protein [soil metagenome]